MVSPYLFVSGLFGVSVRAACASLSRIGDLVMLCDEDGLQFWGLVGLNIFSGRLGGWGRVLSWRGHESVLSMGGGIFNLVSRGIHDAYGGVVKGFGGGVALESSDCHFHR